MVYSNLYARFYNFFQKLILAFKSLWRFRFSPYYIFSTLFLNFIAWWQSVFIFRHLSSQFLVLHYNINFGVDSIGDPSKIFTYPIYGLVILIINVLFASSLYRKENFRVFSHLLLAGALSFALFLNLVLLFIYLVNFK